MPNYGEWSPEKEASTKTQNVCDQVRGKKLERNIYISVKMFMNIQKFFRQQMISSILSYTNENGHKQICLF